MSQNIDSSFVRSRESHKRIDSHDDAVWEVWGCGLLKAIPNERGLRPPRYGAIREPLAKAMERLSRVEPNLSRAKQAIRGHCLAPSKNRAPGILLGTEVQNLLDTYQSAPERSMNGVSGSDKSGSKGEDSDESDGSTSHRSGLISSSPDGDESIRGASAESEHSQTISLEGERSSSEPQSAAPGSKRSFPSVGGQGSKRRLIGRSRDRQRRESFISTPTPKEPRKRRGRATTKVRVNGTASNGRPGGGGRANPKERIAFPEIALDEEIRVASPNIHPTMTPPSLDRAFEQATSSQSPKQQIEEHLSTMTRYFPVPARSFADRAKTSMVRAEFEHNLSEIFQICDGSFTKILRDSEIGNRQSMTMTSSGTPDGSHPQSSPDSSSFVTKEDMNEALIALILLSGRVESWAPPRALRRLSSGNLLELQTACFEFTRKVRDAIESYEERFRAAFWPE